MKKFTLLTITSFLSLTIAFAQEVKKEAQKAETKMEMFISKAGSIIKYIDYNLSPIKSPYSTAQTRIRKVIIKGEIRYFYQIEMEGKYSNPTASIEYSDLLEVIKAFTTLKADTEKDMQLKPDYLENKFTTEDGFQIGYYVSDGKINWYLNLEKYGSDDTIFIKDVQILEASLSEAKNKIEELKKI